MAKKEETISMIDTLAEFKELKNIDKDTMISVWLRFVPQRDRQDVWHG